MTGKNRWDISISLNYDSFEISLPEAEILEPVKLKKFDYPFSIQELKNIVAMRRYLSLLLCLIPLISCSNQSVTRDLKSNLNKTIRLEMFDTVRLGDKLLSYEEFRQMYNYISVVYLEDGCQPCYPKFIEWQNRMDSLNKRNDYTVLFIIQGFRYNNFIKRVNEISVFSDHYYTIMDDDLNFLLNNNDIPRWIIDGSVLIGPDNKIKMIGEPWATHEITELFYSICQ